MYSLHQQQLINSRRGHQAEQFWLAAKVIAKSSNYLAMAGYASCWWILTIPASWSTSLPDRHSIAVRCQTNYFRWWIRRRPTT